MTTKYYLDLPKSFTENEALMLERYIADMNGSEVSLGTYENKVLGVVNIVIDGNFITIPKSWVKEKKTEQSSFEQWSKENLLRQNNYTLTEAAEEREKAWIASRRCLYDELEKLGVIPEVPF